ncbi:MAG: DNA gyrase inhibitor YacG [Planctomycetota bacterium]
MSSDATPYRVTDDSSGSATLCPVCKVKVPPDAASFPFCNARCRKIDLGRWMDERYVVSRPIEQTDLDALE